jgi:hypothetical protein
MHAQLSTACSRNNPKQTPINLGFLKNQEEIEQREQFAITSAKRRSLPRAGGTDPSSDRRAGILLAAKYGLRVFLGRIDGELFAFQFYAGLAVDC